MVSYHKKNMFFLHDWWQNLAVSRGVGRCLRGFLNRFPAAFTILAMIFLHDDNIWSRGVPVLRCLVGFLNRFPAACRPFTPLRPYCSRRLAAAVVHRGIEKHLGGPWLWSAGAGFWACFKGSSEKSIHIIVMVCFYIAVNTESGACTAPPERRGALQAASLVVQVNIEKYIGPHKICGCNDCSLRWSFGWQQ